MTIIIIRLLNDGTCAGNFPFPLSAQVLPIMAMLLLCLCTIPLQTSLEVNNFQLENSNNKFLLRKKLYPPSVEPQHKLLQTVSQHITIELGTSLAKKTRSFTELTGLRVLEILFGGTFV